MQWQSVAFVLSEICSRPPSPDCDRAWGYACTLVDKWEAKMHAETGALWMPIKRLLARARCVRELQNRSERNGLQSSSNDATMFMQGFELDETQTYRWEDLLLSAQW